MSYNRRHVFRKAAPPQPIMVMLTRLDLEKGIQKEKLQLIQVGTHKKTGKPIRRWKRVADMDKLGKAKAARGDTGGKVADKALRDKHAPASVGRKWIDHAEGMPLNTAEHYKDEHGHYSADRQVLHDRIISQFLSLGEPVPLTHKPVALFMLGVTASGKSTARAHLPDNPFAESGLGAVEVDPDAIKVLLPEYQASLRASAKDSAWITHAESSEIAAEIGRRAVADRRNVIYDGTGKSLKKMQAKIDNVKSSGYAVTALMPHISTAECKRRADARAERTGRYVPHSIIDQCGETVPGNFIKLSTSFDSFSLFDNSGKVPPGPKLIMRKPPDPPDVVDKKLYDAFRKLSKAETMDDDKKEKPLAVDITKLGDWFKRKIQAEEQAHKKAKVRYRVGEGIEEVLND